jgi:serum amyloid A protein
LFTNWVSCGWQQVARGAVQAVAHGTFQGGMMAVSGGKFWSGFAAGAASSIASSLFSFDGNSSNDATLGWGNSVRSSGAGMVAFGTVSGGAGAHLSGGNFWQGAVTGLFVSGLNHAMHSMDGEGDPPTKKKGYIQKAKEKASALVDKLSGAKEYITDFVAGVNDFREIYYEMKDANWKNSDKYFHSKANFKASLRGPGGRYAAEKMSNLREITDQYLKGDSRASSVADQKANNYGREQAQKLPSFHRFTFSYGFVLDQYRPVSLPAKY